MSPAGIELDGDGGARTRIAVDDFGVVVIGRNEGERLTNCLASIKRDTDNIMYVDSGSTDASVEEAERVGVCVVRLDMSRSFTAARARNEGFVALKALWPKIRYVQFIDGDCTLAAGWLSKALEFIEQHNDVAIVCGRRREKQPGASIYNKLCDIEWNTPTGGTTACGGDALVRVDAFQAVDGFRAQLIAGEEPELCLRLRRAGWTIWRLDAEMTSHDAAIVRFGQWWRRCVRCGYGYADVSRLHRGAADGIWKREIARAVFWGGLLPLAISFGILLHPAALAGVMAYPLQIVRIAFSRGPTSSQSWMYALFITAGKFPEFQGIMKFQWAQRRRRAAALIEYK